MIDNHYPTLNDIPIKVGTKLRYIGTSPQYGHIFTVDAHVTDSQGKRSPTVRLEEASGFYFINENEWEPLEIYDEETQFYAVLNGILP